LSRDPLLPLYERLNWDAPKGPLRCSGCTDVAGLPIAGAYPSSLWHYEATLGPLDAPRTDARVLMVFQDPRPGESNFRVADPRKAPADLRPGEHRYFCLSQVAWQALRLDRATGSAAPCWPTSATAPFYLRRYLTAAGAWSYDGFLTYFLYLLRPTDAAITDLALCHFGPAQGPSIFVRCVRIHMGTQAEVMAPNVIISFTARLRDRRLLWDNVPSLRHVPLLVLAHPAAHKNRWARRDQFLSELERARPELEPLGIDVESLAHRWTADVDAVSQGPRG
jgi:hypothetical protein